MSEVIQTGSFERMDRFHYDVVDEVRIMAEAGDRNELPNSLPYVSAGLISRFLARLGSPASAP